MKINSCLLLVGLTVLFESNSIPATSDAFELGTERLYSLVNDVNMYDLKTADTPIGYRISGSVKVGPIWGNEEHGFLLRFDLLKPQLYVQKFNVTPLDFEVKKSLLNNNDNVLFYAEWNRGLIGKVYLPSNKDVSIDNLLKSIVSLFQYQLLDVDLNELDISGNCDVKYTAKSSSKFMKRKLNCTTEFVEQSRVDKPLGVTTKSSSVTVLTVTPDGSLETIHSSDHHNFFVNAYSKVGFTVGSLFFLKYHDGTSQIKTIDAKTMKDAVKTLKGLKKQSLIPSLDAQNNSQNLVKLIKENMSNLKNENVGKEVSALTLLKLLPTSRQTKTEDFMRILNGRTTKEIKSQLMDLLGAVQTKESHDAFRKALNFTSEEDFTYIERYLQSLAVGVHPKVSTIEDLLELANGELANEQLKDTLIQTIASMALRFTKLPNQSYKTEVVAKVSEYLLNALEACDTNDCKAMFLRGMQNLRSPDTATKLLEFAFNENYHLSVAAMKALKEIPIEFCTTDMKKQFELIFFQRFKRFDSSARTIALDILLTLKPKAPEVVRFIEFLKSNDKAYEVKQYLVQKMKLLAEKCPRFRDMMQRALAEDVEVNNWNVYGGLKGLSTVLERRFSQNPSFNGSLLSVQEMNGGALKRGSVDLLMRSDGEQFSLFTLGLFAGGLSSFMGGTDEDVDENEDTTATAGMDLAIQGAQMRRLTFFKGQGELMGHVWSGTASDSTPAYQGSTILQDHKQIVVLNNGAVMDFSAIGSLSVDLNGKIDISLWNRNANSEVMQMCGTALISSLELRSSFVKMSNELEITEEPQIHLSSKIDFSSQTALCLQLSQPNTKLSQKILRTIRVPGVKKDVFKSHLNLTYKLPGFTHSLNRKNNEMCNKIFK
ncbi:unnamed protein product [Diamesa serratosioi]